MHRDHDSWDVEKINLDARIQARVTGVVHEVWYVVVGNQRRAALREFVRHGGSRPVRSGIDGLGFISVP